MGCASSSLPKEPTQKGLEETRAASTLNSEPPASKHELAPMASTIGGTSETKVSIAENESKKDDLAKNGVTKEASEAVASTVDVEPNGKNIDAKEKNECGREESLTKVPVNIEPLGIPESEAVPIVVECEVRENGNETKGTTEKIEGSTGGLGGSGQPTTSLDIEEESISDQITIKEGLEEPVEARALGSQATIAVDVEPNECSEAKVATEINESRKEGLEGIGQVATTLNVNIQEGKTSSEIKGTSNASVIEETGQEKIPHSEAVATLPGLEHKKKEVEPVHKVTDVPTELADDSPKAHCSEKENSNSCDDAVSGQTSIVNDLASKQSLELETVEKPSTDKNTSKQSLELEKLQKPSIDVNDSPCSDSAPSDVLPYSGDSDPSNVLPSSGEKENPENEQAGCFGLFSCVAAK